MRELDIMADAAESHEWERASWIMSTIANFAFGNEESWKPADFNAMEIAKAKRKEKRMTIDDVFRPLIESGAIEVKRHG